MADHTAYQQQVKQELKNMDHRLDEMEEKMNSIDTKLTQVVDAILGNSLTKTGGFVNDIDELKFLDCWTCYSRCTSYTVFN